jgi:diguanylate cyclase (GGDEF)-like protein
MPGLLAEEPLRRVFNAWRRSIRLDPLLSRVSAPDLLPLCVAFNNALTGEDEGQLLEVSNDLVRSKLEPQTVTRLATFLAETFADEVGMVSGAVSRSLVSTLGHVCGLMMTTMVSDVSDLAYRDPLTGLENRRAWDEAMTAAVGARELAVCVIDLDGLKVINDSKGHPAGDVYLSQFARDLAKAIPDAGRAYRFGGDEYGILLFEGSAHDLEQLLQPLQAREDIAPFSYGIASTAEFNKPEEIMKFADERMYGNKAKRKQSQDTVHTAGENTLDRSEDSDVNSTPQSAPEE